MSMNLVLGQPHTGYFGLLTKEDFGKVRVRQKENYKHSASSSLLTLLPLRVFPVALNIVSPTVWTRSVVSRLYRLRNTEIIS